MSESCGYTILSPIKRKTDEIWMDQTNDESVDLIGKWDPGQPNGQELQKCAMYNAKSGKFYDDACSFKLCFMCSWSSKPKFTLKGLCDDSKIDRHYVLLPEETHDGHVIFSGYEKNFIIFDRKWQSWSITDGKVGIDGIDGIIHDKILGTFTPDAFTNQLPVGRQIWKLMEKGCNETLPLKLTHVSKSLFET